MSRPCLQGDFMDSNPEVIVEKDAKDEFVPKKAYVDVKNDMMSYKEKMRGLQAELEKYKADDVARQEAEARAKGEYQKIADSYRQKYEESEAKRKSERESVVNLHKLNAIDKAIGGFVRSEYAKMATKLDAIKLTEDGLLDEESINAEVARIRQEHPALLKSASRPQLPSQAPGTAPSPASFEEKLRSAKTIQELEAMLASKQKK